MKLRNKLYLFSFSILLVMAISVLVASSVVVDRLAHTLYDQVLRTELKALRDTVSDTLNSSGEQVASQTAAALNTRLKEEPLLLQTGHVYVIEETGRVIFHPNLKMGDRINLKDLPQLFQQGEGMVEYEHQGILHHALYTTIAPVKWMVLLSIAEDEIRQKQEIYLHTITLITITIVAVTVLLVALFIRRFVGRLQTTLDSVEQIQQGNLDALTVSEVQDDEVGSLQKGIVAIGADIEARAQQQAEKALGESEARYRQLFETANEGIWTQDENYKTTFVNEHMAKMLGYSVDELTGRKVTEFMFEEGALDHPQKMAEREKNISAVYERRMRHKDGTPKWMLISATPIFDEDGSFHGSFAMLTDITDRKQTEKALREQEIKFLTVADYTYDWEYWLDPDQELLYISPSCERITGYSPAEFEADPDLLSRIVYPADRERVVEHLLDHTGPAHDFLDFRIVHRAGDIRWITHGCQPVYGPDGKFLGRRTSNRDTTERKVAEQQLAASEQLFRSLVENSPDFIARYDRELRRTYINPALQKQFEIPVENLLSTTPKEYTLLTEPERYMANMMMVLETAEECKDELSYMNADGELRWSNMRFVPEFDLDGDVATVMVISHDITEQKRMEEGRKAHLGFLQGMDRINRVLQGEGSFDEIMNRAMDEMLDIFDCDRAYMLYPCDPKSPTWSTPFERTKPEYPGVLELGLNIPMNNLVACVMGLVLDSPHPLRVGPGTEYPVTDYLQEQLSTRSFMATALYPKDDRPWELSIQQCSHDRIWTDQEMRLFEEISHRLSDGLNSLLIARNLRESEGRYRDLFDNSPLPIRVEDYSAVKTRLEDLRPEFDDDLGAYLIKHPDLLHEIAHLVRVNDVNKTALVFHEADTKEEMLRSLPQIFIPETMKDFRRVLVSLMRGETNFYMESVVQTLTGRVQNVLAHFSVSPGHEQSLSNVLVSLVDISDRKKRDEQLRLAASVFANSQEGIMITNADNCIIDINPSFTRLTGYTRDEVLGRNPEFLGAGKQREEFYQEMWNSINTKGEWQGELWNRHKSGRLFAELLSVVAIKDENGKLQHYMGAFTDITMFKQHEADLDRIAHYDVLTSVPNRRLLNDRMEQAIASSRRNNNILAVCYLDLDGFKPINDEFGHDAGDLVLVEVARRLQKMLRAADTIARLGGDEFVLLWNNIGSEENCNKALERVLDTVSKPIVIGDAEVSVSASVGVTLYPNDDVDSDSLLRHADHAMYSAKQLGKNRYQIFDMRLERQISARVGFLQKVLDALEQGQLELYYQPKVDYFAGKVEGAEALIRWNDPILGLVGPKEFLPLIEDDNLALDVGRWVMQRSLQQGRAWEDVGIDIPISINVFPRHLKHQSFTEDLRMAIKSYWPEMPPHRLQIEIVESSALEDMDLIENVIKECREMGVVFSLDDFGTGYSSLVYLRRLTIDELKIDQSFVRDMLNDPDDEAIVMSVIGLGETFGLRVVAEGVETTQHAWHLMDLGCRVVQGFALGCPMPVNQFEKWYSDFLTNGMKMYK